jgi:hypothetical protein
MAQANESRTSILSRSRRSGVRSSYRAREANFAIPSAWLGPVMTGLGFSGQPPLPRSGFPARDSSACADLVIMGDAPKAVAPCKNVRRSARPLAFSFFWLRPKFGSTTCCVSLPAVTADASPLMAPFIGYIALEILGKGLGSHP